MQHLLIALTTHGVHTTRSKAGVFFNPDTIAEKSTESVAGYPSGLGMCACCSLQLGAQTGDCYIQLPVFKDKSVYTNAFQNRIQKF